MMYDKIENVWQSVSDTFQTPEILYLVCLNKPYAVVSDSGTIITAVSKSNIVYAIAKTRADISRDEDNNYFYYIENPSSLKVVSCTEDSTRKYHPDQAFVIDNIVPLL
jgi:hypothetical protein